MYSGSLSIHHMYICMLNIIMNGNVPCGVLILINFLAQKYFLWLIAYFLTKNILFYGIRKYI